MKWLERIIKAAIRKPLSSRRQRRRLGLESLELRAMMTAEGQSFTLNQTLDVSGIGGAISGTVAWGDGTSSVATVATAPTTGPLKVRFDYTYDSSNFFGNASRRSTLQAIADSVIAKFSDNLSAIQPSGTDQWTASFTNPSTGSLTSVTNSNIAANEIVIYVGARTLGGNVRGSGEKGAYSVSTTKQAFLTAVTTRGQAGATATPQSDFGPWGGSIAFDGTTNWYFGASASGITPNQIDFTSVTEHELLHVLGFGTSDSWNVKVTANGFVGSNSTSVYGSSPVPLESAQHWSSSVQSNGQSAIMTTSVDFGTRKQITRIDLAAMQDIGWQLITPQASFTASHVFGDNASYATTLTVSGATFGSVVVPLTTVITNVSPTFLTRTDLTATTGQTLSISPLGQFTDPGFGTPQSSPPKSETFTYTVNWGDGSTTQSGNAKVNTIGSSGVLTSGSFDGSHTYATTGKYTVTLVVTDDDGGSTQQQFFITVGVPPQLTVTIDKNSFGEDAGPAAAQLTIQRAGGNTSTATTVRLASSDLTELLVPATVTIPIGQTSITVPVQAVDDTILDGTQRVVVTASADGFANGSVNVDVLDREQIVLTIDKSSIAENGGAGAAVLTVTRSNTDVSQSITVLLSSNDTTEATLPASVVIPAGAFKIDVGITAIDDAIVDGTQTVQFTATATGYGNGTASISVTDYEPIAWVLASTTLSEEIVATRSTTADISIPSPAPSGGVTLTLKAEPAGQLTMPATVTIPAGSTTASFAVSAIDDIYPEGNMSIVVTASATGYVAKPVTITVSDTDLPIWTNPNNRFDVDNDLNLSPLDVLVLINEINRNGSRDLNLAEGGQKPYLDPNGDGRLGPLDVLLLVNEINRRG